MTSADDFADTPRLSVVLVTPDSYQTIRKTLQTLRMQTARNKIEIVLVAPSREKLQLPAEVCADFAGLQIVETKVDLLIADAKALGTLSASAPVVAFGEDHCFPAFDWAEKLIAAHEKDCVAVGPQFVNGNPRTALSWADFLLNFGSWCEPGSSRVTTALPWHNTSYKREVLLRLGDELARLLEVEGTLQDALQRRGETLYLESDAHVHHVNISRPLILARALFCSGRLFGATRAQHWNAGKCVAFVVASPIVFLRRLPGQNADRVRGLRTGQLSRRNAVRVLPLLVLGSLLHVAGEVVGCLGGFGNSRRNKSDYESHRLRLLCNADREQEEASLRELERVS